MGRCLDYSNSITILPLFGSPFSLFGHCTVDLLQWHNALLVRALDRLVRALDSLSIVATRGHAPAIHILLVGLYYL